MHQNNNRADHRQVGRDRQLFATHELVGSGLPLWLPDGGVIRAELEKFAAERAVAAGCRRIYTPVLAKRELFERSGHWDKFSDDMFPPMVVGGEEFVLRPANCPHACLVYGAQLHSYRELPIRLAELGSMFRSELSGVLGGLSRVRQINLDDVHVFCTEDQIGSEVAAAVAQIHDAYRILGIEVAYYRLSLSGPDGRYLGDRRLWAGAEARLADVLRELRLPFRPVEGEAAFYGPKIDVQVIDAAGREETLSTVQLDFNQPERFDLQYVAADGSRRRPVMIHRGLLSAMERLTALLIELYAGSFPVWLAPVQVQVLPVGPDQQPAAGRLLEELHSAGLRAEIVGADSSLGRRIRHGRDRQIPYAAVIGAREAADAAVALRRRDGVQVPPVDASVAVAAIKALAGSRSLSLELDLPATDNR
ncbi:threonine--tRNA ligase [Nakamurella lactea]|uniref:threonine--tRNA ligase n=1 Tax=Nakamurella lactea TaxID=459515 RepID=UPI00040A1F72|nr:threonine--tRNA ligase [Nakamurella lactea]